MSANLGSSSYGQCAEVVRLIDRLLWPGNQTVPTDVLMLMLFLSPLYETGRNHLPRELSPLSMGDNPRLASRRAFVTVLMSSLEDHECTPLAAVTKALKETSSVNYARWQAEAAPESGKSLKDYRARTRGMERLTRRIVRGCMSSSVAAHRDLACHLACVIRDNKSDSPERRLAASTLAELSVNSAGVMVQPMEIFAEMGASGYGESLHEVYRNVPQSSRYRYVGEICAHALRHLEWVGTEMLDAVSELLERLLDEDPPLAAQLADVSAYWKLMEHYFEFSEVSQERLGVCMHRVLTNSRVYSCNQLQVVKTLCRMKIDVRNFKKAVKSFTKFLKNNPLVDSTHDWIRSFTSSAYWHVAAEAQRNEAVLTDPDYLEFWAYAVLAASKGGFDNIYYDGVFEGMVNRALAAFELLPLNHCLQAHIANILTKAGPAVLAVVADVASKNASGGFDVPVSPYYHEILRRAAHEGC